jgi:hypothetical protein
MKAAEVPLYDESKGYVLGSVLKLLVLKTRYGMFDVGFDAS